MIALAVEALAASALLMVAVLALRGPVRRAFGARVAYALWALPVLRLLLPPMPAAWHARVAAPISSVGEQALVLVLPATGTAVTAATPVAAPGVDVAAWLGALWVAGVLAVLAWQLVRYALFRRRVLRAARTVTRVGRIEVVESAAADGPLAFGLVRRVVAFPRDFAARYNDAERELALAHELGHHARGDLWANWIALAVLALHWFDPVAWIAFRAFRADQEMANDAGVLARCGAGAHHAYGCTIVKAAHGRALTPACHLNTVADLKGRLRMLGRGGVSQGRILAGMVATAALTLAGLAVTASGTPAAARMRDRVETVTGVELATLGTPATPATPQPPIAPRPPSPTRKETRHSRVVIVKDGHRTVYEGAAAEAYIAAHPAPTPPAPPAPPVPAAPVAPPAPQVSERNCADTEGGGPGTVVVSHMAEGRPVMVICRNRVDRIAADAAARAQGGEVRRNALRTALASLQATRASLAAERLPGEARTEALSGIDDAIAELNDEIASNDD